jgi:hypothetical protein
MANLLAHTASPNAPYIYQTAFVMKHDVAMLDAVLEKSKPALLPCAK